VADLRRALAGVGLAVLEAPPGAGKTTVVPLRLLDESWLGDDRIVILEPRRVATRAAARRMAHLVGDDVGGLVGYRTRDEHRSGPATRIEVVTEGILTRRLQRDPSLPGVGLVIFDEIHERNLQADLALALTLDVRAGLRPDLRLVAMSATVDTTRVARLLGGSGPPAPTMSSEGRTYPVDVRWRPPTPGEASVEVVSAAVLDAVEREDGDVLVFLAGARDNRQVERQLRRGMLPDGVDVLPLFGALPAAEQDRALAPSPPGRRRVVLATDIAETSLTVAGVRTVVDSGEVRVPRYDASSGMTRLRTGPTARSSAEQRAGRAGRVGPGTAYRLWSETGHRKRAPFPEPEINLVDLTALALELAVWGAGPDALAFLDPPPARSLAEARGLLTELGALGPDGQVTEAGRAMVGLPVHPRLARMVVAATGDDERGLASSLASLLEERDVLTGRPEELPVDLVERVRLLAGTAASDTRSKADVGAVDVVRRRRRQLLRRLGGKAGRAGGEPSRSVDAAAVGTRLAVAYPDRLAQAVGRGRFRLRHGGGAVLPHNDGLSGEEFVVVAELGVGRRGVNDPGEHLIRRAAAIDRATVEQVAGDGLSSTSTLWWDPSRDDLRLRTETRVDQLVLDARDEAPSPGEETAAALVDEVRRRDLDLLAWGPAARAVQARVAFLRGSGDDSWPDLSTEALVASADEWLAPHLVAATGRADLGRLDLVWILRDLIGHGRRADLDRAAPESVRLDNGRQFRLSYADGPPTIAAKAQHLYGVRAHPTVADGRVPVVVQLLSPADRPIQITSDLPGFWAGSWADVRKDMAGRYPKHDWPVDPASR
jgi:ATP-dependent helicase HrpB